MGLISRTQIQDDDVHHLVANPEVAEIFRVREARGQAQIGPDLYLRVLVGPASSLNREKDGSLGSFRYFRYNSIYLLSSMIKTVEKEPYRLNHLES